MTRARTIFAALFVLASLNLSAGELRWTTAGPETGQVTIVKFDPIAPNVVWAATVGHGIFRSIDRGVSWAPMNNGLNAGAIGAIVIDPNNSSVMWVAHYKVWRTLDGGQHWVAMEDLLPGASRITSMLIDPAHTSNLFVGTTRDAFNPSAGVQKSTDAGETWFDSGSGGLATKDILAMAIDRTNPSILFAGGLPDALNRPMFKSTDGGATWFAISSGVTAPVDALAIDPRNGAKLFASQSGALITSNDGGLSWALDGSGVPPSCCNAIVYERNSSSNIWLATFDDVYRTTDGGATWVPAKIGNERVSTLDLNAEATVVAGTDNDGLFRRDAGSSSWTPANNGFLASDVNVVVADPAHAGTVYAGTENTGMFKSTDHGRSWQRLSADLLSRWFGAIVLDPKNSSTIYATASGTGGGFLKSTDAGATWSVTPLSVYALAVDPVTTSTIYLGTTRGVSRSTDGGNTFTQVSKGLPSFGGVLALAIDPVNTNTLYAGVGEFGIYKSTDGGVNWTKKSPNWITARLAVDATNPAVVFATTNIGLFKSTDAGEHWTESDNGIPVKSTLALWIDPLNGNNLYTSIGENGVYRSTDGGMTWTQLGGVAPAEFVWSITVEPGGNVVHAGASGGVFSYEFGGSNSPVRRRGASH